MHRHWTRIALSFVLAIVASSGHRPAQCADLTLGHESFDLRVDTGQSLPVTLGPSGLYLVKDGVRHPVTTSETASDQDRYLSVIGQSDLGEVAVGVDAATTDQFHLHFVCRDSDVEAIGLGLTLREDEFIYGFADPDSESLDQRGRVIGIDPGDATSCGPVPFYASTRGYALLVQDHDGGVFDIAQSATDEILLEFQGPSLELVLFIGDSLQGLIQDYQTYLGPLWIRTASGNRVRSLDTEEEFRADLAFRLSAGLARNDCDPEPGVHRQSKTKPNRIRIVEYCSISPDIPMGVFFADNPGDSIEIYSALRNELQPYFRHLDHISYNAGTPAVRPLVWNHQDDRIACAVSDEYTLGDDILAAPVLTNGATRDVYLPEGVWIDYWRDEEIAGPAHLQSYPAPPGRLPLFIRRGAMIPLNVESGLTGHGGAWSKGALTLDIIPAGNEVRTLYIRDTRTFRVARTTESLTIEPPALDEPLILRLRIAEPHQVRQASAKVTQTTDPQPEGRWWYVDEQSGRCYIRVEAMSAGPIRIEW